MQFVVEGSKSKAYATVEKRKNADGEWDSTLFYLDIPHLWKRIVLLDEREPMKRTGILGYKPRIQ